MEEFRIINNYENYSVSNLGNVKNNKTGRILKQVINGVGYYVVNICDNNKEYKSLRVHRLVGLHFIQIEPNKKYIDHKDNNKLNNNVNNLRWVTSSQNSQNAKLSRSNKSGVKGVIYSKNHKKWRADIRANGINLYLGLFNKKDDAITARLTKSIEIHGNYMNECERFLINIYL